MAGEKRFARLGAKVADLEQAALDRLLDADILLAGERHASAIVMGLYALEITLKIAICRRLNLDALPVEFQIHDFEGLLVLTGLSRRLTEPDFLKVSSNWDSICKKHKNSHVNELRYGPATFTSRQAKDLLRRLRDPSHGVLRWLSEEK